MAIELNYAEMIDTAMTNYHNKKLAPYVRAQSLITAYYMDYSSPKPLLRDNLFNLKVVVAVMGVSTFHTYLQKVLNEGGDTISAVDYLTFGEEMFSKALTLHSYPHGSKGLEKILPLLVASHGVAVMAALLLEENIFRGLDSALSNNWFDLGPELFEGLMERNGQVIFAVDHMEHSKISTSMPLIAGYTTDYQGTFIGMTPKSAEVGELAIESRGDIPDKELHQIFASKDPKKAITQAFGPKASSAGQMQACIMESARALKEGKHPQVDGVIQPHVMRLPTSSMVEEKITLGEVSPFALLKS